MEVNLPERLENLGWVLLPVRNRSGIVQGTETADYQHFLSKNKWHPN